MIIRVLVVVLRRFLVSILFSVNPRPATAGGEAEWNKLGLSSSALNSR